MLIYCYRRQNKKIIRPNATRHIASKHFPQDYFNQSSNQIEPTSHTQNSHLHSFNETFSKMSNFPNDQSLLDKNKGKPEKENFVNQVLTIEYDHSPTCNNNGDISSVKSFSEIVTKQNMEKKNFEGDQTFKSLNNANPNQKKAVTQGSEQCKTEVSQANTKKKKEINLESLHQRLDNVNQKRNGDLSSHMVTKSCFMNETFNEQRGDKPCMSKILSQKQMKLTKESDVGKWLGARKTAVISKQTFSSTNVFNNNRNISNLGHTNSEELRDQLIKIEPKVQENIKRKQNHKITAYDSNPFELKKSGTNSTKERSGAQSP